MVTVCHCWLSLSGVVSLVQQLPTCLNPRCYILANIPSDALALLSPYTGGNRSDLNNIEESHCEMLSLRYWFEVTELLNESQLKVFEQVIRQLTQSLSCMHTAIQAGFNCMSHCFVDFWLLASTVARVEMSNKLLQVRIVMHHHDQHYNWMVIFPLCSPAREWLDRVAT